MNRLARQLHEGRFLAERTLFDVMCEPTKKGYTYSVTPSLANQRLSTVIEKHGENAGRPIEVVKKIPPEILRRLEEHELRVRRVDTPPPME